MPSNNIDHLGIPTLETHFEPLVEWYKKALSAFSSKEIMLFPGFVGLGNETPNFWIIQKETNIPSAPHFDFSAPSMSTSYS